MMEVLDTEAALTRFRLRVLVVAVVSLVGRVALLGSLVVVLCLG